MSKTKNPALDYHEFPTPGKISVEPTKACSSASDLSLAYSPGVAQPCLEIEKTPDDAYRYTAKGNLVAVITNGSAVLGLGDIGPQASKPVMEGKGVLFKTFANIDVFDLELDTSSPEHFIETVAALAPTFGGINLEDIKAPECFIIEEKLKDRLDIPVFHDDQHGTAIIAAAALINALELTKRKIGKARVVVSGAGAAAIACVKLMYRLGLKKENVIMCDSKGPIYAGRTEGMNPFKEDFAVKTSARTLAEAMKGADVFLGLSQKDVLLPEMLRSMSKNPIVFAMANPDPEITYELATATRSDVIMATGRSDYPNQVNNVLGFPYIFRGALDVRARRINEEMKMAAVKSLAALAKEPVPQSVIKAYGNTSFSYGTDYLIPKPFDPRVLYYVAPAVAKAAIETGVARKEIDIEDYTLELKGKQNHGRVILSSYYNVARRRDKKQRIAYAEGANERVLNTAIMVQKEGVAEPILLGNEKKIRNKAAELDIDISDIEIVEPRLSPHRQSYRDEYYRIKQRKGITKKEADLYMKWTHVFGSMMLRQGDIDGMICGVDRHYPEMIKPIFSIVGLRDGISTAAGLYLVSIKDRVFAFTDTTINVDMTSEKLADISILAAEFMESLNIVPRVAMLSYSNFGSVHHESAKMVQRAKKIVEARAPELEIDGEMQADTAVALDIIKETYPFCRLTKPANVLVFPDMQSGNISYKLLQRLGDARVVGPIILGLNAPAFVMQRHASVDEIFNMSTVISARAALKEDRKQGQHWPQLHLAGTAVPSFQDDYEEGTPLKRGNE
jgi:malate dehydrogenase (oxaloacetate-decarboxylating)(NADP+)